MKTHYNDLSDLLSFPQTKVRQMAETEHTCGGGLVDLHTTPSILVMGCRSKSVTWSKTVR